ncbi:serine hydrolase domain-containing protein [Lutimonas sp.]|uniref:serine hydrolase domain-containing protein n=1 Tax=Lutimonas sp. TaxID=1872403 RepID=UPI003D9ACBDE
MKIPPLKICGFILCLFISALSYAQVDHGSLEVGKPQNHSTNSLEKHIFHLDLEQEQFVFLRVIQQGVDLQISTYDVNGDKMADYDSPNGTEGPEIVQLNSDEKGVYKIEVYPYNEEAFEGDYEIQLDLVEPIAQTKEGKVDQAFYAYRSNDGPGASVAIQQNGKMLYSKGYGLANLEYDIQVEPSSVFHIASVSKQFTAFSILLLQADGKLNVNDDIRKYIPEVPDFGKTITLQHLATHTSGLRDQWNLLVMAGWRMDDVITKEHVLKLVSRQEELNFEPGEEMYYCNTGFTLLAEVVARVSGMSFAEFTKERIFDPLEMNETLFYDDHEKIVKNRAYSYHSSNNGYKKSVLNYANVGATSLFTTVEDLSKWAANFDNTKVGSKEIIHDLNTRAVLNNGDTIAAAMGQFVGKYKGLDEIQHGGADAGYRSYLTRIPDEQFSVAVFGNSASFNSGNLAHAVVDIYLSDLMEEQEEAVSPKEPEEAGKENNLSLNPELIKAYVGDYELQPGFNIKIFEEEGGLAAQPTGQSKTTLEVLSETEFNVPGVGAKLIFETTNGSAASYFDLHQGGQITKAERLEEFDKEEVDLNDFTGEYYSPELATNYSLKMKEGKLIAEHQRTADIELDPVKPDVFNGSQYYFRQVEFKRDDQGKIVGFAVSNGRVRNLKFNKIN